jgi:mRNA-degrading endonuclease RelE of RelBE toxin-antitoxin system
MSFKVTVSADFKRESKRLLKKYASLRKEIESLILSLEDDPTQGTPIGQGCYKIRLAISSKGKGKSGGARVITLVWVKEEQVFMLSIYDKSEQDDISDSRLKELLGNLGMDGK